MNRCVIEIVAEGGIFSVNMMPDESKANEMERLMGGVLDVAIRTALEHVQQRARTGEMIEGKNIEHLVSDRLAKAEVLRSLRRKLGQRLD